jgi:hypothetical protein
MCVLVSLLNGISNTFGKSSLSLSMDGSFDATNLNSPDSVASPMISL